MRLLYVPNEHGDFRQVGFRRPLENLLTAGLIDDLSIFSLLWRVRAGGDPREHVAALITRVRAFQPDVVLMQHLGGTSLQRHDFELMREAADFQLIYHEADPYSRFIHPLPQEARRAGRAADVVFTVGSSTFADNFRRAGARDVRFESHCFESERYDRRPVDSEPNRRFDVVIVANKNTPRLRGHPNWRERIKFVETLERRFGSRVAVFGKNWAGPSAKGPIPFDAQQDAIRSAWVSANWDHYAREESYFSNRLPISLAAASVHATTLHPGYDKIFADETKRFLIFGHTPTQLSISIERYLESTSTEERIRAQRSAQEYAYKRFRQDDQLVRMLNFSRPIVDPISASEIWDESARVRDEI